MADPLEPTRKLLAVVKPAKPISEMTPEERRALVDQIFDAAAGVDPGERIPGADGTITAGGDHPAR